MRRERLVREEAIRLEYKAKLAERLKEMKRDPSPRRTWKKGIEVMLGVAAEVAGTQQRQKKKRFTDDELVERSNRHAELRQKNEENLK